MIMSAEWVAIACGVATFIVRALPMYGASLKQSRRNSTSHECNNVLTAFGPAAIAALLVISLWPAGGKGFQLETILAVSIGLSAVVITKRATGGIAFPTLIGAFAYGVYLLSATP